MSDLIADISVSRETIRRLKSFESLVQKWTPRINLVSKSSIDDLWIRHIVDSAQIYSHAPEEFETWVDIGSGGGFPGVVVAILAKEMQPKARFVLIESDQRKATFLRVASQELDLDLHITAQRIEKTTPQAADVVSARALASLDELLPAIERHLATGGIALLHKGKQYEQEIAKARESWSFALEAHQSLTDPNARLLTLKRIKRDLSNAD